MLQEKISATGVVQFVLKDENGNVKDTRSTNIVVDSGLTYIAARMAGVTSPAAMGWIAVGTGSANATSPTADTQTLLGAEVARSSSAVTITTTTVASDTVQYVTTFAAGTGTAALTEAGIFNVVTANTATMLARTTFAVINKGTNDTLTITWKITIA
jgi:hypothetical protein